MRVEHALSMIESVLDGFHYNDYQTKSNLGERPGPGGRGPSQEGEEDPAKPTLGKLGKPWKTQGKPRTNEPSGKPNLENLEILAPSGAWPRREGTQPGGRGPSQAKTWKTLENTAETLKQ